MIEVQPRNYGVFILDTDTQEGVAIETENLRKLVADLQQHLPWDFNQYALFGLKAPQHLETKEA